MLQENDYQWAAGAYPLYQEVWNSWGDQTKVAQVLSEHATKLLDMTLQLNHQNRKDRESLSSYRSQESTVPELNI